ncbi:MAG: ChpI protein [Spirochaetales bacterium]|nr:ChpI protein [Spirochaetales bacterium]
MKTAVSIPDNIFLAAEKTAKRLNIPRSQLYSKAVEEYINNHNNEYVTEKLNAVYSKNSDKETEIPDISVYSLREATKNDTW